MNTQPLGPNQERWLRALESGEYRQGRFHLRTSINEYCCLGIGCELLGIPGMRAGSSWKYDGSEGTAPKLLENMLALRGDEGNRIDGLRSLAWLNDHGKTFAQITQIVRADPAAYFSKAK